MRALLQRVSTARVEVEGELIGAIGAGLAVLIGVQRADTPDHATRLAQRLLTYRIFDDAAGRMNLDVTQSSPPDRSTAQVSSMAAITAGSLKVATVAAQAG